MSLGRRTFLASCFGAVLGACPHAAEESKPLEVLDRTERDRYEEIRRQMQDALVMTEDAVADQLQLSLAQRNALHAIAAEQAAAAQKAIGQDRPLLSLAQLAAKKRVFDARTRAVLALDQQAVWTKLIGAPIPLPVLT